MITGTKIMHKEPPNVDEFAASPKKKLIMLVSLLKLLDQRMAHSKAVPTVDESQQQDLHEAMRLLKKKILDLDLLGLISYDGQCAESSA